MCNAQPVLTWLIGLSGCLLAFENRDLRFWSPQKHKPTLTVTLMNVSLLDVFWWSGVSAREGVPVPAQCQCWPHASLHSCPQVEETTASIGHNQSKVTEKIAVTRSASSVLQAVLGLFSSSRSSLSASLVSRTFSEVALSCVQHWARFLTQQVWSYWKQFSEGLHPVLFFSRQNDWNTCILFIIATGYEGAKYTGFFLVTPLFLPAEIWV